MTMRMTAGRLLSLPAAIALAAGIASAEPQSQPNAVQGFSQNRNQPIQVNAQMLEVRDKKKMATYSGNVVLVQGDTTLRCKTLVVFYDGEQAGSATVKSSAPMPMGSQQVRRIAATGNVMVTQNGQTATGEKAIYDVSDDKVRLFPAPGGTVTVTQGPNVLQGDHLVVDLGTGVSHVEGNVRTLVVPNSTKGEKQPAPPTAKARATNLSGL